MTPIVLVVEEQPVLRQSYARFLRREGYEVLAAAPSEDTLRLVRESPPDVLVVDPGAGAGRGREIAQAAVRADATVRLVFNTTDLLELDFSGWLADAHTVRSHPVAEVGAAVRALLARAAPRARIRHSPARARA
jgi:DNA-binding response OmpR family regulator